MTNEKWWEEYEKIGGLYDGNDLPKIVAEAERKGEMKAWEEIMGESRAMQHMEYQGSTIDGVVCTHTEHLTSAHNSGLEDVHDYAEDKLTSLKTP